MEGNETNNNNIINKYKLLNFTNKKIISFIEEVDPILNLINDFSEIKALLNKIPDKFKFIYFHRKKIKKILYNNEEQIILDSDKIENTLDNIFYLSLLLTENIEIVNYKYSIDYIKQLNESNENNNLELSKMIFSKIILDLIEYFKGFEEYDESNESFIDDIKNKNIAIIQKNKSILEEFNLDDKVFINKSIDEIYSDIIKILLLGSKDYKYIKKILNQLNLKKIDITKFIFKEISKMLSNDKSIKEKRIIKIIDLFKEDKIEFYYILLKYILKNLCYIYQIPFLIETRTFILKNIKSIKIDNNNKDKKKLEYLIDTFKGSKYNYQHFGIKIIQKDNNNGQTALSNKDKSEEDPKTNENYQKLNYNSIGKIFQINDNENQQQIQNVSTSPETSKEKLTKEEYIEKISLLLKGIIIHYLINKNEKEISIFLKEKENKIQGLNIFNNLIALKNYEYFFEFDTEQLIKYKSFVMLVNFIEKSYKYISEEYKNKNFGKIALKLDHEKLYEKQNKNGIYNITCKYGIFSQDKPLKLNYKDENILLNGFNQGFLSLLCEINESLEVDQKINGISQESRDNSNEQNFQINVIENQQQNQNRHIKTKKTEDQDTNIDNKSKSNRSETIGENKIISNKDKNNNNENNKTIKKTDYNGIEEYGMAQYIEKISHILEELVINYIYNNGNKKTTTIYIIIEKKFIEYEHLIALNNKKFLFDMDKEQFIKYSSFVKLVNFIQKIEELFSKENKKNLWNFSIKLEHEKLYEKQNKNGIYNITCYYGIFSQNKSLKLNYKDENILLNGFNQGFLSLLCEINEFL